MNLKNVKAKILPILIIAVAFSFIAMNVNAENRFYVRKVWDLMEEHSSFFGDNEFSLGAIATGDLDQDGNKEIYVGFDIASSPNKHGILIFEAVGDKDYTLVQTLTRYGNSAGPVSFAYGDINGDGKDELLAGTRNCKVYKISAIENNRFTEQQLMDLYDATSFVSLSGIAIGDLDNDGILELVICGYDNVSRNAVRLFVEKVREPTDELSFQMIYSEYWTNMYLMPRCEIGDVDNDGKGEIMLYGGSAIEYDAQTGDFVENNNIIDLGVKACAIGDLDGDGINEVFVVALGDFFVLELTEGSPAKQEWYYDPGRDYSSNSVKLVYFDNLDNPAILVTASGAKCYILAYLNGEYSLLNTTNVGGLNSGDAGNFDGDNLRDIVFNIGAFNVCVFEEKEYHNSVFNNLLTADLTRNGRDELIVNFGPGYGIWIRYDDGVWANLHEISPESIVAGDYELIIDFGNKHGLWRWLYNMFPTWTEITNLSPDTMVFADLDNDGKDELVADFGCTYGIWSYNGLWSNIHGKSAGLLTRTDLDGNGQKELTIDFGPGYGIWTRNTPFSWSNLLNVSPEYIMPADLDGDGKDELIADFGPSHNSIWVRYGDTGNWTNPITISPELMVVGDLNGNGQDDIVMDLGSPHGIWVTYDNDVGTTANINGLSPLSITTGDLNGNGQDEVIAYYGPSKGVWIFYDNTEWVHSLSLSE